MQHTGFLQLRTFYLEQAIIQGANFCKATPLLLDCSRPLP
jgi:hypothetical protein